MATKKTNSINNSIGEYTFPVVDGTSDQVLKTNGTGALTWEDESAGSAAGSDGQIQYNNGGALGGDADLFWDDTNKRLGIGTNTPSRGLDFDGSDVRTERVTNGLNINLGISTFGSGNLGSASGNFAILQNALFNNTTGDNNLAIGEGTLQSNTTGRDNIAIGKNALNSNTTKFENIAIGSNALINNTSNFPNVAIGYTTIGGTGTGNLNTAIGWKALNINTNGSSNIAIGYECLFKNTTGAANVAVGRCMAANTTGAENVAIGESSLNLNTTGARNTALGVNALKFVNPTGGGEGEQNIGIGYGAGDNITTGSTNIIIGYNLNADSATADDQLNIGGVLKGDLSTGDIEITGGLTLPVSTVDVSNPPTDAELDSEYGTPATVGAGYTRYIDDNGAGTAFYQCVSDGTNWWVFTGTKAV